jgi:hypothetical protein
MGMRADGDLHQDMGSFKSERVKKKSKQKRDREWK